MSPRPAGYENAVTFSFGDSPELADELLALVLAGTKTATCDAVGAYSAAEPMPVVGRRDVVLDGRGRPACAIETIEVELRRFDEVDARFAADEGEGERTLDYWRRVHEDYFRRHGTFAPDMMVVCERLKVVEVFARD